MFETLNALPPDPILGLTTAFKADDSPKKVDLGVGVFKNDDNETPIMRAVKAAERTIVETQTTKAYAPPIGVDGFGAGILSLVLGNGHSAIEDGRATAIQNPGGCGALHVAARLIMAAHKDATVWVSDPTWANHRPLLKNAGVPIRDYPYFDYDSCTVRFDAMMETLKSETRTGDLVLLHGCCHNPTGADLTDDQWRQLADLMNEKGLVPFIDLAYQGFGRGVDADAFGVRLMAESVPELLVTVSGSKNFGLYRERVGSLIVIGETKARTDIAVSHALSIARGIYSMPPAHGATIASTILNDEALRADWLDELNTMRERIQGLRDMFADSMKAAGVPQDFSFVKSHKGMFSFLGLTKDQVRAIRAEGSIYMTDTSRINVTGVNRGNIDHIVASFKAVLAG
ncbi:amino acid aminotransferase [Yunchengibacter salinarum]|uniref:amino acid aminotransferase n=1 Tax=Yunchengibacter salinarum TaxID=3133399 RepID=UPI0035B69356